MSKEERAKEVLKSALGSELTAGEAVSRATQGTGAPTWVATRALYSLLEEKKAGLTDPSPPGTTFEYLASPYSLWFWGTVAALLVTLASIYVLSPAPPFIYVRYVFGSLAVLFLPGYTLIEALYPKKEDLDGLERLALSIGLSLALVPLVGLLLNYTPWGIRLDPIVVSLSLLDISLATGGAARKESYVKLAAKTSV
ncbi:MAG: DUF1616 domain-containing protein [Thaumarchaeota archaeon]|nr:DUF1616 domain-containing protein [Nitrososphaerota archaeon]